MYTDINGNYIVPYCVVKVKEYYYCVEEVIPNSGRDYFIKLRNGCVVVHTKPEECEVVI
jgi:hypothetical protein